MCQIMVVIMRGYMNRRFDRTTFYDAFSVASGFVLQLFYDMDGCTGTG